MKLIISLTAILLSFSALASAKSFKIDTAKSEVAFEIFKFKINGPVNGKFKEFEGNFEYDEKTNTLTSVKATIKATSVDTTEPKRDDHLRSPDFFDVEKFKVITFISSDKVVLDKDGKGKLKGKFTLHGVTKEIELKVELKDKKKLILEAKTKIDRNDYGIKWNKTFKLEDLSKKVLGDEVRIDLKIVSKK